MQELQMRANKMAQWVNVSVAKTENLSSFMETTW